MYGCMHGYPTRRIGSTATLFPHLCTNALPAVMSYDRSATFVTVAKGQTEMAEERKREKTANSLEIFSKSETVACVITSRRP